MPVVPHMDRCARSHVIASSTGEVVTHLLANGASEEHRAALYERCLLRTYDQGLSITDLIACDHDACLKPECSMM